MRTFKTPSPQADMFGDAWIIVIRLSDDEATAVFDAVWPEVHVPASLLDAVTTRHQCEGPETVEFRFSMEDYQALHAMLKETSSHAARTIGLSLPMPNHIHVCR